MVPGDRTGVVAGTKRRLLTGTAGGTHLHSSVALQQIAVDHFDIYDIYGGSFRCLDISCVERVSAGWFCVGLFPTHGSRSEWTYLVLWPLSSMVVGNGWLLWSGGSGGGGFSAQG